MRKLNFLILSNSIFLLGILFAGFLSLANLPLWFYVTAFTISIFLFWFFKVGTKFLLVLCLVFSCALLRFFIALPNNGSEYLLSYNDAEHEISVVACISDEVDKRRDHQKLSLSAVSILNAKEYIPVEGNLLATVPKFPGYEYAQCLQLRGVLQDPGEFDGFSYDNYLARYGIYSVMYRPNVQLMGFTKGNFFFAFLFNMKKLFEDRLNVLLHEPYSSFAAGLITGSRKGIPDNVMQAFSLTGLTHIIAISGYNITLLIVIISALFGFLPRIWRFFLSIAVIVIFVFFVGASAAVVRAALMGVIALIAIQFGRKSFVLLILFFSAALMNFYNPFILYTDVGFQLSFAATLGLIVFADRFEKYFSFLPDFFAIKESMVMTLAAQVFTLPLIVFHFARISLISPIANVLVGPLIPFAMLFSFLAVCLSYIWQGFGVGFAFFAYFFLDVIVKIAQILAELPFASFDF